MELPGTAERPLRVAVIGSGPAGFYAVQHLLQAGERMVELAISRRNAAWSLEQGGIEYGSEHFVYMKLLHTGNVECERTVKEYKPL